MAEKIRVELDNATGAGWNDIAQGANKAGQAVDHLGDEAQQTREQLKKAGDAGSSAFSGETLAKLAKGALAFAAIKQAIQGTIQGIKAMSDEGSPAFKELTDASAGLYSAMVDIANDPAIQSWVSSMADTVRDDLVPALKMVPDVLRNMRTTAGDTWQDMQQGLAAFITRAGEASGILIEGSAATNEEIRSHIYKTSEADKKAAEEKLERDKEALVESRVKLNVTEKIAAIAGKLAADEAVAATKEITSLEELSKLRTEKIAELEKEERAAAGNSAKKTELLKQIEAIARREKEIPKEVAAAKKAALEEEAKARTEAEKKAYDAITKAKEAEEDFASDRTQKVIDLAEKKRQQLLKAIEDARGDKGGNAIQEAKEGLDQGQVLKQIQKKRADEAEKKLREQQAGSFNVGDDGKASDEDPKQRAAHQKQLDEQIRRARQQASAGAFKDARGGKVGAEEVGQAQTDLLNSQIKQAEATGRIGSEASKLAQDVLNGQQSTQNQLAEQAEVIDEIRQQIRASTAAINKNASTFRNQRGGRP